MRVELENGLYEILATNRSCDVDTARAEVGATGTIDSIEGVELIAAAESRYGVAITDQELARVCTRIPQIAALVAARLGGNV